MGTSFCSTLTTCTSIGRGAASAGLFERLTKIRNARTKAAATAIAGIRTLRLARIVFSWARMIVYFPHLRNPFAYVCRAVLKFRSEERRVGKECRSRWWADE